MSLLLTWNTSIFTHSFLSMPAREIFTIFLFLVSLCIPIKIVLQIFFTNWYEVSKYQCLVCLGFLWSDLFGRVWNYNQQKVVVNVFIKYLFSHARKIFGKANISYPLIHTLTCVYQVVKNFSFSENFAYLLNEWSLRWYDCSSNVEIHFLSNIVWTT